MPARWSEVWNRAAPWTANRLRAARVVCTATTAVAATGRATRPVAAGQARAAQVPSRNTPPRAPAARAMRSVRGAAARVRRSTRPDRALPIRPRPAAAVTTARAGRAPCRRSETVPVPRRWGMARAVNVRTTAAMAPVGSRQPRSGTTPVLSTAQAMRAVCASTEGGRRHTAVELASARGFLPYLPAKPMVAGGGGGGVFASLAEASVTVTRIPPRNRCRTRVARSCPAQRRGTGIEHAGFRTYRTPCAARDRPGDPPCPGRRRAAGVGRNAGPRNTGAGGRDRASAARRPGPAGSLPGRARGRAPAGCSPGRAPVAPCWRKCSALEDWRKCSAREGVLVREEGAGRSLRARKD